MKRFEPVLEKTNIDELIAAKFAELQEGGEEAIVQNVSAVISAIKTLRGLTNCPECHRKLDEIQTDIVAQNMGTSPAASPVAAVAAPPPTATAPLVPSVPTTQAGGAA